MAGFVSATVGFAAPMALAAMAFGKYFNGVLGVGSPVLLSFVVVWLVTLFHLGNLRVGSAFQNVSTLVKLLLDRCADCRRLLCTIEAANQFFAGAGRQSLDLRAAHSRSRWFT